MYNQMGNLLRIHLIILIGWMLFFSTGCRHASSNGQAPANDSASYHALTIEELNQRIKSDSTNPEWFFQRAKLNLAHHSLNDALFDMSKVLRLDSTKPDYLLTMADIYLAGNHTSKCKDALERCVKIDPRNTKAILKLAELYFYVKKYDPAIEMINSALKIDDRLSAAYYLKGLVYREVGDTSKSISSFITATEQNPDDYPSYEELAAIYAKRRNPIALQYFANALRIQPASRETFYNRGKYFQDNQQYELAKRDYFSLLKLDTANYNGLYNLGAIHLIQNQLDSAAHEFSACIKLHPTEVQAIFALGVCQQFKGEKAKAIKSFQDVLKLQPDHQPAKEALKGIKN